MIVRTCLLISDDPDDHIEFSEALYEITDDTVLISVADPHKAIDLLSLGKCIPEYVFLNVGTGGFHPDAFFNVLEGPALKHVRVIACGESVDFSGIANPRMHGFLDTDISYSELKSFLQKLLKPEEK